MRNAFQPLLFLLASCTENQLIRQIEFLKAENEMLRKRVPKKRIFLNSDEKQRLIKLGKAVGSGLRVLITIVSFRSFQRWLQTEDDGKKHEKKMGRPRTPELIRDLVLRFAGENSWGYTRILGELKKLGVSVSRSTVVNLLKQNGFEPSPKRSKGNWDDFLKMHAETLWQCDFFSKRILTARGLRQTFVLVFLHIGSRKVFVTAACPKPDATWMQSQANRFLQYVNTASLPHPKFVIHDLDGMFVREFDDTLREAGIKIRRVGPQAPNLNAFVERWIQSIKHECLDNFIVFGEGHFNYLISEYVSYYHTERPHQALGNNRLVGKPDGNLKPLDSSDQITCQERLGGLLKHYSRQAA